MRGPGARGGGFSLGALKPWDGRRRNGEFSTTVARVGDLPEPLEPRPPGLVGRQGQGVEVRPHCWRADPEYDHHGKTFWRGDFPAVRKGNGDSAGLDRVLMLGIGSRTDCRPDQRRATDGAAVKPKQRSPGHRDTRPNPPNIPSTATSKLSPPQLVPLQLRHD